MTRAVMTEENHIMVREKLGAFSVIPARNENIPIWKPMADIEENR